MLLYYRKWFTVDDMYKYASENNLYLLAMHAGEFWRDYITNHAWYDKKFRNMFKSFRYFLQDGDEDIETVTTNFIDDVAFHLSLNSKKYDELYRLYLIENTDMPISGNVNLQEILTKVSTDSGDLTYGSRQDSSQETTGARTDTVNRSESLGARSDSESSNIGSQNQTSTKKVFAFNSNDYQDDVENTTINGARQDSKSNTLGAQSNSVGGTDVKGSQTNNGTFSKGQQIDSRDLESTEDYTKTIRGNNGYVSVAKTVEQYKNFWNQYEFYEYIFKEICKDLLLI